MRFRTGVGIVILAVAAMITGACSTSSTNTSSGPEPRGATIRENNLYLFNSSDMPIQFEWDGGYSITDGQPWGGVESFHAPNKSTRVTVQAGRHASKPPQEWFRDRASTKVILSSTAPQIFTDWGDKMNFSFTGTLVVEGIEYAGMVFGQDHFFMDGNSWSLGTTDWLTPKRQSTASWQEPDRIVSPDRKYYITPSWGAWEGFKVGRLTPEERDRLQFPGSPS